ncbi:MAG TPA: SGNH/GDSL hydrolase family protein [Caulobacteraceae bacterium]|jgi:lysophospholipase L1-like esterase
MAPNRTFAAGLLALLVAAFVAPSALAAGRIPTATDIWAATWEASPQGATPPPDALTNTTVRQIAHVSLGGIYMRVKLSNEFGDKPLEVKEVHIALATGAGSSIQAATDKAVMFSSRPGIIIPAGAVVVSDPISIQVPSASNVAVTIAFGAVPGSVTSHYFSMQDAFIAPGDVVASPDMAGARTLNHNVILSGLDVSASRNTKVVVALGNAFTAGYGSTANTNQRWPDVLSDKLASRGGNAPIGVVNAGIGGNRLLHDLFGSNALSRFDRDVLAQPAVGYLIVLLGTDDFGLPGGRNLVGEDVTSDDVIAAYRQLIQRAHMYSIKVFIGTLPPFGPIPERPGYYSDAAEAKREAVNNWIRTNSKEFEGVIDFEAAVRDPANRNRLAPQYDSGDHLDPNDAGYKAMVNAIEMRLFE